MNTTASISREKSRVEASAGTELSRVSAVTLAISAAAVGCWATACLFAGAISSGGPIALISNLATTIIG